PPTEAFRQGVRELCFIEGKNIVIEWRFAEENADRTPMLLDDLVRLKVDVIAKGGSGNPRLVKRQVLTIPNVIAEDFYPVRSGFIASLARPGGNITGFATLRPELSENNWSF